MKQLLMCFMLLPIIGMCQIPIGSKKIPTKILGKTIIDNSLVLPQDTVSLSALERGIAIKNEILYIFNGIKWIEVQSENPGIDSITLIQGGPITSLPELSFNPNTLDIVKWIDTVFYRSRPPTTTITGGTQFEYRSPQSMTQNLNFTVGRSIGTTPIQSVVINGINKTIAQPTEGSSYSGVHTATFPANTNITFQITATTVDNKSSTSSTTFSFVPKRYYGWINVTDTVGIRDFGYNDSKITSLSNELSTGKSKSWNSGSPGGSKIYVYAYYSAYGDLNQFDMNGFSSLDAMNKVTRQFTNSLGFTGSWTIYWTKNAQTTSSSIIAN